MSVPIILYTHIHRYLHKVLDRRRPLPARILSNIPMFLLVKKKKEKTLTHFKNSNHFLVHVFPHRDGKDEVLEHGKRLRSSPCCKNPVIIFISEQTPSPLVHHRVALSELMISDRHQKREIRQLEQELPRWQVLVDNITGT